MNGGSGPHRPHSRLSGIALFFNLHGLLLSEFQPYGTVELERLARGYSLSRVLHVCLCTLIPSRWALNLRCSGARSIQTPGSCFPTSYVGRNRPCQ